jgi:hypothetical protein
MLSSRSREPIRGVPPRSDGGGVATSILPPRSDGGVQTGERSDNHLVSPGDLEHGLYSANSVATLTAGMEEPQDPEMDPDATRYWLTEKGRQVLWELRLAGKLG